MIEIVAGILVLMSALAIFTAALGIIRFDNLLARTHLVTKVTSYALMLLLIAINLLFFNWTVFIKSLIIFHVLIFLSPISAHLIAKISKMLEDENDESKYNFPSPEEIENISKDNQQD
jgi:multicomponent Na+:H+ antiporter subunit G